MAVELTGGGRDPGLPLWARIWAVVVFPFAARGSMVWWYRMHMNTHAEPVRDCPFCIEEARK